MEVTAKLRFLSGSPQKVRLVADQIRGKGVQDAVNLLQVSDKRAARPLAKLLRSAIANAEDRHEHVDLDRLYVKEIQVNGGPTLKRFRPAPQGRALGIIKRSSHILIKLDSRRGDTEERKG